MYSLACLVVTAFAAMTGELDIGALWVFEPGTYREFEVGTDAPTWSVGGKLSVIFLFTLTGYLALFFCQTLTKHFGALVMSIASTSRKATSLFLSFLLFNNVAASGHLVGGIIFIGGLTGKILLRLDAASLKGKASTPTPKPVTTFV